MSIPRRPTLIRPFPQQVPGAPPGTIRVTPNGQDSRIEFFGCDQGECREFPIEDYRGLGTLVASHQLSWINIDGLGDEQMLRSIAEQFQIHELALEDIIHEHQRAKVEEYPEHLFIVLRMVWMEDDLYTEQISVIMRKNVILTFQSHPGDCLGVVRNRLRDPRSSLRSASLGQLAHAILDAVVDGYYPVIEEFGEWIDEAEDLVPHEHGTRVISEIHDLRRELLFLRKCLWPLRETFNILLRDETGYFGPESRLHLRDTSDHVTQLMEVVDSYREMCADLRDFYYAVQSQRTNEVMKVLTIVATIFMPLSFIAGVYGMNFDTSSPWNMPELKWWYGYPFALGLMVLTLLGMGWFFARRRWMTLDDISTSTSENAAPSS